jgi:SAM-dependent methyltransferase
MLHPKIIVLVNQWVWKNPFYGFIVRYADYYPVFKGLDHSFDRIRSKVEDGYSILVFPEASRTPDGKIKRFHQGAFGIADALDLDIQPIIIHGAYDCLPKTDFFLKSGKITLKFFNRIKVRPAKNEENETYRSQTKEVTAFYRNEYAKLQLIVETPDYLRGKLIGKYVFKGPILEWYLKVKLKLERNYIFFDACVPREANVVDIGCGYGFLSVMLRLSSDRRNIVGIDYDDEKIGIAKHIARNIDGIEFKSADISKDPIPAGDIYILNDVLHYLPQDMQLSVLGQCLDQLSDGGKIILRDTDTDLKKRTLYAKFTEFQSTKVFRFNKTQYDLSYLSGRTIKEYIEDRDFTLNRFDKSKFTSNITYVITHKV